MSAWQPISSAPRGNDAFSPYLLLINRNGVMAVGCWVDDGDWYLPGGGLWKQADITHWQHLPTVPDRSQPIESATTDSPQLLELENCDQCMGSGYGGHPDSGALCSKCHGRGGYDTSKEGETQP